MSIDTVRQLLAWKPPFIGKAFIGNGILVPQTKMMIFGLFGSWKSILSLYTAYSISQGTPWFGHPTRKAIVFRYQAEMPKFMDRERMETYAHTMNLYPDEVLSKTVEDRAKLDTTWGYQSFERDIQEVQLRNPGKQLIVLLDPLYLMLAGHISDEYDVKKFLDNMNIAIAKYHIAIIAVHHPRKRKSDEGEIVDMGGEESMGSSYLPNWFDTIVNAKVTNPYSGSNIVTYRFDKHRNARRFLKPFTVEWNRDTLAPTMVETEPVSVEDVSIHGLEE